MPQVWLKTFNLVLRIGEYNKYALIWEEKGG